MSLKKIIRYEFDEEEGAIVEKVDYVEDTEMPNDTIVVDAPEESTVTTVVTTTVNDDGTTTTTTDTQSTEDTNEPSDTTPEEEEIVEQEKVIDDSIEEAEMYIKNIKTYGITPQGMEIINRGNVLGKQTNIQLAAPSSLQPIGRNEKESKNVIAALQATITILKNRKEALRTK